MVDDVDAHGTPPIGTGLPPELPEPLQRAVCREIRLAQDEVAPPRRHTAPGPTSSPVDRTAIAPWRTQRPWCVRGRIAPPVTWPLLPCRRHFVPMPQHSALSCETATSVSNRQTGGRPLKRSTWWSHSIVLNSAHHRLAAARVLPGARSCGSLAERRRRQPSRLPVRSSAACCHLAQP